jgi:putative ATPase
MDIFEYHAEKATASDRPLAERMRPRNLDEFIGQTSVVGKESLVRRAIEADRIFSMILWGPPGCGKTTLARIVAQETKSHFIHFSAVLSGVKDIRAVIEKARDQKTLYRRRTILFVDEIHRFNKAQQDAFLHHVESGLITLIGATTENPSFEVIAPLLSRCRVITLTLLSEEELAVIMQNALEDAERGLGGQHLSIESDAGAYLARLSDGDARSALNNLEAAVAFKKATADTGDASSPERITLSDLESAFDRKALIYDKSGESHYNLISALHKSMRGSDADASLYWLIRMLEAGEDPLYIARRMVRFASEDIGNADPGALGVALQAMEAFRFLGSPEGELALAQAAIYLATAPKSNAVYAACKAVQQEIRSTGSLPPPLHIRNAPTGLMRDLGYGRGYRYAHDHKDAYVPQEYLPDELRTRRFYHASRRGYEQQIHQRIEKWRALAQKAKTDKS